MLPKDIQNKEAVLHLLRSKTDRPVSLKEIAGAVGIHKKEMRPLKRIMESLIRSGDVFKTKSGFYGLAEKMNLATGFFEAHRDGYGFVIPERPGERDLFIPPRKTSGAMSGDKVIVRIESMARREGSVIKILERAQKKVVGQLYREGHMFYVKPKNRKIHFGILVSPSGKAGAREGDHVVVELTSYPTAIRPPEGKVLKILPDAEGPGNEIEMIVEEHSLPSKFPSPVLSEIRELRNDISLKKRVDCRALLTVTIDGETAKDYDDAVSIKKTTDGFILWVHIADVGHYVAWDSPVDLEARKRGTSVYFPGSVIPMLPEKLSNDLCSLVPRQDRPTFTAEIHFDKSGRNIRKDFYPSIIHSNERMTYTSVRKILVDRDITERQRYGYLLESLETMEELCGILRDKRIKRGSLDFDLPEPEVLLDIQGNPESIIRAERNLAHMMIEEFMIAANEAVASHLEQMKLPSIYRIHEKPDPYKLEELRPVFNSFGLQIKKIDANTFQTVLKKIKGKVEESLLNILLLRSLKQAKYSTDNTGHFGLASESYTHFTSPIRRYPDLVVHRMLRLSLHKNRLSKEKREYFEKLLPEIASHASKTEREADEAEREIVNAMRVWFMKDKIGNEYKGMVSNISANGMKIQLKDFFVEGFVHVSYMPDDYYRFDEKSYRLIGRRRKKTFTIGKEVNVRIERVNIEEREIVLGLA